MPDVNAADTVEAALAADVARRAAGDDTVARYADGGVMTHWLAVSAWTRADEDGSLAYVQVHFRDDVMPLWQLRGLLHEALRICTEQDEDSA